MVEPNFEKIGGVIFGTQRLDWTLTVLTNWMANRSTSETEPLSASKIDGFASTARAYFARPDAKREAADKFASVMSRLRWLNENQEAMKSKGEMGNIDEAVVACNEAHTLMGEIIDQVGYSEHLPPAFMIDRQIKA